MAKAQPLPPEKISKGSGLAGVTAWAKKKPAEAGLAGAGVLVVLLMVVKKKSAAASTSTATTTSSGIDPATGVPYATEIANAQSSSLNSPYATYPSSPGGSGTTGADPLSGFESWFSSNYPPSSQTPVPTVGPGPLIPAAWSAPVTPVTSSTTPATDPGPTSPPPTNFLSPAQATAAVASGVSARSALAQEAPAAQLTGAQRHAQEVANRGLRKQLK